MARINGRVCSMRSNIRPELIEEAVTRYYRERPVELTPADIAQRTAAIEALAAVSQEAVLRVKEAKSGLIVKLKDQQIRLLRLHTEEGDDISPDAFREERARLQTEINAAEQSLAETELRLSLGADELKMALELASDVADVYESGDQQTRRSYNLAFFKKVYVPPDLDQYGLCGGVEISDSELTEPYAVLLNKGLEAEVVAEQSASRLARLPQETSHLPLQTKRTALQDRPLSCLPLFRTP